MVDFLDVFLSNLRTVFALRRNNIAGKLDMQKSFYFAKELGVFIPFNFRWGKLGPFSYELSNALEIVTRKGFITYKGDYEFEENNFRYIKEITVSSSTKQFFTDLEKTVSKNGSNKVYFIEVAASLHFLYKYSGLKIKEDVVKRLYELKPDRMDDLKKEIDLAWDFLRRHKLIQ